MVRQTRRVPFIIGTVDIVVVEHMDPGQLSSGGIESIIYDFIKFSPGVSFAIVGISADPDIEVGVWHQITLAGSQVWFIPVAKFDRMTPTRLRLPHSLLLAIGIARFRRRIPNTLTHSHRVETGFVLRLLGFRHSVQFLHNDAPSLTGARSDSSWRYIGPVYRSIERFVVARATKVVIFSRPGGERLQSRRPDVVIGRTWFDPSIFMARPSAQAEIGITVCWVGRLDSQKDPALAIKVMSELVKREPDAVLEIAGAGGMENEIRALTMELEIAENVRFLGPLSHLEVASLMSKSSVLLLSSHYEGSPTVLIEAGACGLPVVATMEADPDRALARGLNGIRVEGRNPSAFADAIIEAAGYSPHTCVSLASQRSGPNLIPRLVSLGRVFD